MWYNSAVFSTLAANEYAILIAAPEFLDGGPYNATYDNSIVSDVLNKVVSKNSTFQRLEKEACIKAYEPEFKTSRRDLVIVGTTHNSSNTIFLATTSYPGGTNFTSDVCPDNTCQDYSLYFGGKIDYCLSEQVKEKCKLEFSLYIMIIVIFCNLVKAVTMGLVVWKERTPALVTLGDAVSSFMEFPDVFTEGMCLVTKADILKGAWKNCRTPKKYKPVRNFWFRAASLKRWLICNVL
ncbi:hypothetical protein GP486_004204 [Trichoglossum hirsutum]|uniref:Uncharacterized protein n=1 Tax=Trichoglossum hirsutum TaxID=265104 RepID=A0A9P8LBF1_9PEZI|nr:hypothetical protein GP486_004204 [Trichoglossum hirsutum]